MTIVLRTRAGIGKSGSCSRTMARAITAAGGDVVINPVIIPADAVQVSYGVTLREARTPVLNAKAGLLNKLEELQTLENGGVHTVPFWTAQQVGRAEYRDPEGVWYGRKLSHTQGKDIMVVLQPEEFQWRTAAGAAYFTQFVPIAREYRVWVYRRRHLATYEKRMARPDEYKRVGRSAHNGFGFYLVPSIIVPREAVRQASLAVDVLDLDYGAVDILEGKDGQFYVLEVNSAPGVEGEERFVLRQWAQHVVRWAANPLSKRPRKVLGIEQ